MGIRNDVPGMDAQRSGIEKKSKMAGKVNNPRCLVLRQRETHGEWVWGAGLVGLQRIYRNPFQKPEQKNLQGFRKVGES